MTLHKLSHVSVFSLFLSLSTEGHILPPQNVSLLWIDGLTPQLSWAPPQHSETNCTYTVISKYNGMYSDLVSMHILLCLVKCPSCLIAMHAFH